MTVLEMPDFSDSSLNCGDVSIQIIYDDKNVVVTLSDEDLINSTLNAFIVSYYKKSNQGCEKICELKVPRSPPSSESVSYNGDTKNLDEELDDTFQLNINQNQHYSVLNWADEISYEEPTNIPSWALIPGVDFDKENVDDFNQLHHQYVINWADEPVHDGPVDVPDWALIPGLDVNRHTKDDCSGAHWAITENIDDFSHHHEYVINWADEPVLDGHVDVPDWALIPGINDGRHINSLTQENVEESEQIYHKFVINWAEEPLYEGDVDIPSWALIPDFKFNDIAKVSRVGSTGLSTIWE